MQCSQASEKCAKIKKTIEDDIPMQVFHNLQDETADYLLASPHYILQGIFDTYHHMQETYLESTLHLEF